MRMELAGQQASPAVNSSLRSGPCAPQPALPSIVGMAPDWGESHNPRHVFDPPLYIQRYMRVAELVSGAAAGGTAAAAAAGGARVAAEGAGISVVDVGCAEMAFFRYLKQIDGVRRVTLVDICQPLLAANVWRVTPDAGDRLQQRVAPLHVRVLAGSVAARDLRLADCHVVTAIELVEHLHAEELAHLPDTVFGHMRPQLAVFTTPNSEYNVVFGMRPDQMRHYDHKFEWSRRQFAAWCAGVVRAYPQYTVSVEGVGAPPASHATVGHCSQIAVFRRLPAITPAPAAVTASSNSSTVAAAAAATPYQLVYECVYPHCSTDARLLASVDFWCRQMALTRHSIIDTDASDMFADADEDADITDNNSSSSCSGSCWLRSARPAAAAAVRPSLVDLSAIWSIPSVAQLCHSLAALVALLLRHGRPVYICAGVPHIRYDADQTSEEEVTEEEGEWDAEEQQQQQQQQQTGCVEELW